MPTTQGRTDCKNRWMIRGDMPEVYRIERAAFEIPWSEEDFFGHLRQRNCIGKVAEHDGRVVGYVVYTLHKQHLELLNLAVAPEHKREGVGRSTIEKLKRPLRPECRRWITTLVRETNLDAQLFLRTMGFEAVAVIRDHYAETDEDAYVMEFDCINETHYGDQPWAALVAANQKTNHRRKFST